MVALIGRLAGRLGGPRLPRETSFTLSTASASQLPPHPTSIHKQTLSTHIIRPTTGQKDDGSLEIGWRTPALCGYALKNLTRADRVGNQGRVHLLELRRKLASKNAWNTSVAMYPDVPIHVDSLGTPFVRERLDQSKDTVLGCGICWHCRSACKDLSCRSTTRILLALIRQQARDVDYLAAMSGRSNPTRLEHITCPRQS
ncbi:hypothetical protein HMN09_00752300 [Mycena chlorophos]|uniref:Uncharacterized protein n=1 Tax=Mycena chlorophos TaxID=658473 RepID=A0A8H6SVD0_MYCCL|nr:hypothetical protein HMN09_00752300 [Mycena chlorophos]